MNHRYILDLARQAGIDVDQMLQPYPGGFPKDDALVLLSFAAIITEECMKVCSDVENDTELSDYQGGFRDGALMCREGIKEKFDIT